MKNLCVTCSREVADAHLCQRCASRLEQVLAEMAALDHELELTETRQTVMGNLNGSKSAETPVVFNVDAATARQDLHATLVGWIRDLEPDVDRQPRNGITPMSRWLMGRLETIRQHLAADEILDEITYASREAWRIVDRPRNRSRIYVTQCLEVSCDGELWARVPVEDYNADDESTHAKITCTECEVVYPAETWMSLGRRVLARLAA